jgi:hypothetical protein
MPAGTALGEFLRARRELVRPEDVNLSVRILHTRPDHDRAQLFLGTRTVVPDYSSPSATSIGCRRSTRSAGYPVRSTISSRVKPLMAAPRDHSGEPVPCFDKVVLRHRSYAPRAPPRASANNLMHRSCSGHSLRQSPDEHNDRHACAIEDQTENGHPEAWVALLRLDVPRKRRKHSKKNGKKRHRDPHRDKHCRQ